MKVIKTPFEGLFEFEPRVFHDDRGYFFESYREDILQECGINLNLVQDNTSYSEQGVIRGLHFQRAPYGQAKLIRVITGKILDVVVDLRPSSKTYQEVYTALLDSEKNNMIFVPEGFAHGFAALEKSHVHYKTNSYYNKESESGIRWDDPDLAINWMIEHPIVSEKDQQLQSLNAFTSQFS